MSGFGGKDSYWDAIPVETVLDVCKFLSALDLLSMCAAYPTMEHLVMNTGALWQRVHLPFPDSLLRNYPGWRANSVAPYPTTCDFANSTSNKVNDATGSRMAVLHDERYRLLSEPDYYDLPDIEGGEYDSRDENTAWIILDVLNRIPLRYTRHLSFDSPPCHLCVYPCKRFCACECHQNEQGDRISQYHPMLGSNTLNVARVNNMQHNPLPPLSQPLQNLFDSGLVDFSQHIDLRALNEALSMQHMNSNSAHGYPTGISNISYLNNEQQHAEIASEEQPNHHTYTLNELDLQDTLFELGQIDDYQSSTSSLRWSLSSRRTSSMEGSSATSDLITSVDEVEGIERGHLSEEEVLEQHRQQSETRAAYQRARLLIRVLSLGGLETLETLRAPWWPAARIYTIRQQLERWSCMIEEVQTNQVVVSTLETPELGTENGDSSASSRLLSADNNSHTPFVKWHSRWTNTLLTHCREVDPWPSEQGEVLTGTPPNMIFPLPNLSRFILRSGGEVMSHERHSIGVSASVLSGRSSEATSLSRTPSGSSEATVVIPTPRQSSTIPTSTSSTSRASAQTTPAAQSSSSSSYRPIFRYCHHCGSQYLHASTHAGSAPRPSHGGCFCKTSYAH